MRYRIAIIGLGLMGASLASALRGFRDAEIVGADLDADVCRKAQQSGAVSAAYTDPCEAINGADLVIFCVYAHNIPVLIEKHRGAFKPGAVLSDICGVKSSLYARLAAILPVDADYVGIHPMAGKERDGFDNADPAIFNDTGFIICPLPQTTRDSVELMRSIAEYIGATKVSVTPFAEHDAIIAYTSDLMHIASAGLCMTYHPDMTSAFTAGAYRDCTRVADINAEAWTELVLDNRTHTGACLDAYIADLQTIRQALAQNDADALRMLLQQAGDNKREMLKK